MQEIYMPALGMASTEVYLAEWSKQPGDAVGIGDTIALIETDKAELNVESPVAGILGRHLFDAETSVPSGATITHILGADEQELSNVAPAPEAPAEPERQANDHSSAPEEAPPAAILAPGDRQRDEVTRELEPYSLSPRARHDALVNPVPQAPETVAKPHPAQLPEEPAALAAPSSQPPAKQTVDSATTNHRAAVARAVSRSWAEIPHFAVTREIRVEKLQEVLRSFRAISPGVTLTDVVVKAYALALVERFDTTVINIGLAVATPRGVAIPVLLGAAKSDLLTLSVSRKRAVERAIDARQNADDLVVPHSSVSNLGSYGVDSFTGIVPFGQTSLLTVGAAIERPVVEHGSLVVGTTMNLTLNVDHREWDGQHAAEVLRRVAAIAAEPAILLALS